MEDEFKWSEMHPIKTGSMMHGDQVLVTLQVKAIAIWSDKIIDDVDEFDNPMSFKEGLVLSVLPQKIIYNNQPHILLSSVSIPKP